MRENQKNKTKHFISKGNSIWYFIHCSYYLIGFNYLILIIYEFKNFTIPISLNLDIASEGKF